MELTGILVMAFGFGLLHALDADHLLAVSGLSGLNSDGYRQGYRFSLRWAVGHGSSVLLIGGLVLFLGMAIPERLSDIAEQMVGYMLLAIGSMLLLDWHRKKRMLMLHRHDQLPLHVHMTSRAALNPLHRHRHGTLLVGLVHGLAGSAPLLAVLPLSRLDSPLAGLAYLLVFCFAVLISMLCFGGILGRSFSSLQQRNYRLSESLRLLLALLTIVFAVGILAGWL